MLDEFRAPRHPQMEPCWAQVGIVFFDIWETNVNLRCNWNRFSKAFGADAGQLEGHFVL